MRALSGTDCAGGGVTENSYGKGPLARTREGLSRLWAWVELNYRPHAYQAKTAVAPRRRPLIFSSTYARGSTASDGWRQLPNAAPATKVSVRLLHGRSVLHAGYEAVGTTGGSRVPQTVESSSEPRTCRCDALAQRWVRRLVNTSGGAMNLKQRA